MSIPSELIDKIKDKIHGFHCEACGKKCDDRNMPKFNIYLEKWFEKDAKSATEVKLCPDCAGPVVDVIKKAKAFAAMKRKDIELDPHADKKPYHFGD